MPRQPEMAQALQCPNCGTKKRLDGVASDTFRCEECGQVLKVPPTARRASSASASPAPPGGGTAPPPRRKAPSPGADPGAAPPARTAAVAAPPVVVAPPSDRHAGTSVLPADDGPEPPAAPRRGAGKPPRDALPLAIRLGAWVLAVPIGLAIIGIPARSLGYLTSQKLLDVIVKHNLSRFVPLLVIVVLWALATTILVEIFIEGGRWLMLRRRRRHAGADDDAGYAPGRVPPPPSRRSRRPAGTRRG
ncbi:MAG TPA: hypothetical protein VLV81_13890 [Acidimicrobiia bacterium]|nr:hypothetical protein [Acidimicrobiia bacterium]